MPEPGDGELVDRARRGHLDAFDELVRRYEATAIRVASMICGSGHAPDAAQEGFVRAYRALHRFDPKREFRPWLLRIVVNAAKNKVRSEQRHLDVNMRAPETPDADDIAGTVVAEETRQAVLRALLRLPERDRIIIACRWFEEMTEREIATALQIRPGTVKSRLSRAMVRLRDAIVLEAVND